MLREARKWALGDKSVVNCDRVETELWAIECCVLRKGRKLALGDKVMCAEEREKIREGRKSVLC